jgi:hypothetical protein
LYELPGLRVPVHSRVSMMVYGIWCPDVPGIAIGIRTAHELKTTPSEYFFLMIK